MVAVCMLPSSWCSAEIDQGVASIEEPVLPVQLDQLEGRAGTIALVLGELIELIESRLRLGFFHHD
jgi:hypothetical protein